MDPSRKSPISTPLQEDRRPGTDDKIVTSFVDEFKNFAFKATSSTWPSAVIIGSGRSARSIDSIGQNDPIMPLISLYYPPTAATRPGNG